MMTLKTRVEMSVLHRQGMSIRAIARQLSCSRETVRRYIRSPLPIADIRYKPRAPRPCKLDPFKPYILERVAAARPQWIPANVLLREIRQRGYEGGYSMLTAFLHPMKQPITEEVTRFETEPGFQMQVDFTIIRLGHNPLLAFIATLGWSRATFVKFYSNQDSAAWCDGIESALRFFGRTPHQLLFDNAKAIIIERDIYGPGKHALNGELGPLADAVAMFFEIAVPAVIDGEKEFGGTRDIHGAKYKAELQSCKAPERRSRDARPVRALRSTIWTQTSTFGLSLGFRGRAGITAT